MPHEFFTPTSETKLQTRQLVRATQALDRNIHTRLEQSGIEPPNQFLLMQRRQLEAAKVETRYSMGIISCFCLKVPRYDRSTFFKILLDNSDNTRENLIISSDPRHLKLEYTKSEFINGIESTKRHHINSREAFREACRILRMPII